MSRLGAKPIEIPDKVKVLVQGTLVSVEGPLGKLSRELPAGISVEIKDKVCNVKRANDSPTQKSLHGTLRRLVLNMVEGVSKGFTKELQIEGVGFRATAAGPKITMTLGYSHLIDFTPPAGIKVAIDAKQTGLSVTGADKELVGQVAADIRRFKKPEPYKGTGIRYKDEVVRRKAGKSAVAGGAPAGGGKK
jgi:large subunit ribosomal protein L6